MCDGAGKPGWTKYHVLLDRENFSWFPSKNKHKPRGFIPLSTIVGAREAEKETQRNNSLLIKSLHTYFFYTETEEARDMWVNEIRIHASKAQSDREIGSGDEIVRTMDGVLVEEEINFDHDALKELGHELRQVRAVRTYKSRVGSELSFNKGNVITVLKVEGDRYKGVLGRRKGWFPRSHVQDEGSGSGSLTSSAAGGGGSGDSGDTGEGQPVAELLNGSGNGIQLSFGATGCKSSTTENEWSLSASTEEPGSEDGGDGSGGGVLSGSGSSSGSQAVIEPMSTPVVSLPLTVRKGSGIRGLLLLVDDTSGGSKTGSGEERTLRKKGSRLRDKLLGGSSSAVSPLENGSDKKARTSEKEKEKEKEKESSSKKTKE
ncbi:PH domain containing protein [Acanthamoeba castellanii str. Neff]|uniref:PH domain containing protein n=1 Tax=Acanthamoeba castellanii (strain ATCC 30010 / Neff) TaxID=1257118 RepID=L8HCU6_ACACF|nr:PH domain containing protein [Acanthamoeba castellanii str. Neff]ELR23047.1 PH domain containing protein [Acanthamoeba castellanii str. Neff]